MSETLKNIIIESYRSGLLSTPNIRVIEKKLSDETISHYRLDDVPYREFVETGKIGISDAERAELVNEGQKAEAQRKRQDASSLFNTLPEEARISNKQLREVEGLKEQLGEDPNFSLTKKQNDLMELSTLQKSI